MRIFPRIIPFCVVQPALLAPLALNMIGLLIFLRHNYCIFEVPATSVDFTVNGKQVYNNSESIGGHPPYLSAGYLSSDPPIPTQRHKQKIPEIAFMITTAKRPGGAFYIGDCLDALINAEVNEISVFITDVDPDPHLREMMAHRPVVRFLHRSWWHSTPLDKPYDIKWHQHEIPRMQAASKDDASRVAHGGPKKP